MAGRIMARSPYYITASGTTLENAILYIYIWAGSSAAKPTTYNYKISKTPVQAGDDKIIFEISQFIRDEFEHNRDAYDDTLTDFADCLWVETSLVIVDSGGLQPSVDDSYLAVDGYGYYSDGINPSWNFDEYTVRVKKFNVGGFIFANSDFPVPAHETDGIDRIETYINGVMSGTTVLIDTNNSQDKLRYESYGSLAPNYLTKVILKNGTTEVQTINFEYIEDCIETAKEVRYYDRNGALSTTYMFGRGITSLKSKRDDYRQDVGFMSTAYSYDSSKHQKRTFDVSANESLVLNSGFVPENQNEIFKQIILSELVWVDDKPVNVKDSSFTYKTNKQDKLINYTLNLDYAYSEINNVY